MSIKNQQDFDILSISFRELLANQLLVIYNIQKGNALITSYPFLFIDCIPKELLLMSIGINIKKRRYELHMSQQDLADALGYKTRSTIAKIESGENDVSHKKLLHFAEVLDTTVEYLIAGTMQQSGTFQTIENVSIESFRQLEKNRTVAVILAGGKSKRNQQNIPNQFINILGKPVIVYCLEAYQVHPAINDIYIVCLKGWEKIVTAYAEQYHITKLRGIIPAAASGILSVQNGLDYIKDSYSDDDIIIFQESTRPMVTVDMISQLLQSCYENGSANICQTMKDYVQFTYDGKKAMYIDRDAVVSLQSPEAYRFKIIKNVFGTAMKMQHHLTESCCVMLMYNLGFEINFIETFINNIKIVRPEDIAIIVSLIKNKVLIT